MRSIRANSGVRLITNIKGRLTGFYIGIIVSLVIGAGCAQQKPYVESHEIKSLTVVFVDEATLQQQWKERTGQDPIRFLPQMRGEFPSLETIRGFFDFTTNTLYCPKWNYEVCGHELHHAALGHFHPDVQ